jgi:L-ribulose-5-phosphate 3-epimerase
MTNRRDFLKSGLVAAASALSTNQLFAQGAVPKTWSNSIGVSTYSFWQFKRDEYRPIEKCLEIAAELGFDGVEILKVQMEGEPSNSQLQKIKQRAFSLGLDLMGYSTHQSFVKPDKAERQRNVDKTIDMIEEAYRLGIPTLRINTGRWGTSGSFDELMANMVI